MNRITFKLNKQGVGELLKSDGMQAVIEGYCETVRQNAGGRGYATDSRKGRNRIVGEVRTDTEEATRECFKNNTLLKALHG